MILNIPQAEKRCSQADVGEGSFCDGPHNCGLPRPSESVELENQRPFEIFGPPLDFVQRGFLQAIASIPVLISKTAIQDDSIGFDI